MRAAIYARFSCSKQREASIDDQVRECRAYCDREGWDVVAVYSDYAVSGRTDERPQFQRMIREADSFDAVVVFMMDRFSRDPYDAPIYKKELKRHGVSVVSALERIDPSPDGLIMEKLLEGLAARESMVTSIRTRRGMEGNAKAGRYNGDRVFGYKPVEGYYQVDESEAELVRLAYSLRLERMSFSAIAKELAARGVRTYQDNPCSPTMVSNMLKNERYTGVYIWDDVRIDGGMPAIVDRATWEAVQMVRGRKNRKEERFEDYALSGKAICAECGRNMQGVSGKNRHGVKYCYYRCPEGHVSHRKELVEGRIVEAIRGLLMGEDAYEVARAAQRAWSGCEHMESYNRALERLTEAQRGKDRLLDAIQDGVPYAQVRERFEALMEQEEKAKADMLMHAHDAEFDVEDFVDFLRFGATLDDRSLLDAFVFQVSVGADALAVVLNYDSNETPKRLDLGVFAESTSGSPLLRVCEHALVLVVPF